MTGKYPEAIKACDSKPGMGWGRNRLDNFNLFKTSRLLSEAAFF